MACSAQTLSGNTFWAGRKAGQIASGVASSFDVLYISKNNRVGPTQNDKEMGGDCESERDHVSCSLLPPAIGDKCNKARVRYVPPDAHRSDCLP
jgi:hypothetical protein